MSKQKQYCITAVNQLTKQRMPVTPPCSLKTAKILLSSVRITAPAKDLPFREHAIEPYPPKAE